MLPLRTRRILSLWFPRLGAERLVRAGLGPGDGGDAPFATVAEVGNTRVLASLNGMASGAGLRRGQPLRDAFALCPDLATHPADPAREAAFLSALRRWAGRFSPWVAEEPPEGLVIDLTGCAHLFGGEAALVAEVEADCADLGMTVRIGVADTQGSTSALARYAGQVAARLAEAVRLQAEFDVLLCHDDFLAAAAHEAAVKAETRDGQLVLGVNGFLGAGGGREMIVQGILDASVERPFLVNEALRLLLERMRGGGRGEGEGAVVQLKPRLLTPMDVD
jgi:hypothetical protein